MSRLGSWSDIMLDGQVRPGSDGEATGFPMTDLDDIETVVQRLKARLAEGGRHLDALVDALKHPSSSGKLLGPSLAAINFWPGEGPARCAPILLAVARGSAGKYGYKAAMAAIRRHLVTCNGITRGVVLVTDSWLLFDAAHRGDWIASSAKGIRFRVLLAGRGIRGAVELPLDLRP